MEKPSTKLRSPPAPAEIVRRVLSAVSPRQIILFGSGARGELGPQSDLDVLVVFRAGADVVLAEEDVYRRMWGLGFAVDIIAIDEDVLREVQSNPYLVFHSALKEGRELYRDAG